MFDIFEPTLNYLDPVSGSFITQFLIAVGGTLLLYYKKVRSYLQNIVQKFKKK
tara:strand:+ start:382 stop:540 length:159 start_codon:yes stop_codon:yes gene_type:complete